MSGSLGGSSKSTYTSTPVNLQDPNFRNLAGPISGYLGQLFSSYGYNQPNVPPNPTQVNGQPSNSSANPLVAPLTGTQNQFLGNIANAVDQNGGTPLLNATAGTVGNILNPLYPQQLATSPQTQAAIQSAVTPLVNAFNQTTIPGLVGQFTASGQRVNSAVGKASGATPFDNSSPQNPQEGLGPGSSAFDKASANAQSGLLSQVGAVAGQIANNAYQTGLQQQTQAINQATNISESELNNLFQVLQQEALPQIIQQYGINQGLQLYQQQVQTILTALGLGTQAAQPVIGNNASGTSSTNPGLVSGIGGALTGVGNFGSGVANLVKANPFSLFA